MWGSDGDLLILIFGVTFARREAAGRAACVSEFPWPKTVSWNGGLILAPGCEHSVCARCCVLGKAKMTTTSRLSSQGVCFGGFLSIE